MNCRKCIRFDECSKKDGTTRFYGKEIASDNVEELCEEFSDGTDDGERKVFFEAVREAYEFALQEGIRANTVLIDKGFAKVSGVHMAFQGACGVQGVSLPPMILGLEARIAPLPAGYGFVVTEVTQTERDKLYAEAKAEGRREVIEQLKEFLFEREDEDAEAQD